ncbi:MAG: orotidine-5'-phosphate decarboxylase [Nitrospinae bacterium]|nr:orotidine-5'-phosphate decarboxylase [Nitrospinota bacterium]
MTDPRNRLIVALDAPDLKEALRLLKTLKGRVDWFKIGSQLYTAEGPAIARAVKEAGAKVFLDLKFHDIPATVARACRSAMTLGVDMLNVHALGGGAMMRAAAEEVAREPEAKRPIVIAVTVLTSMGADDLEQVGIAGPVDSRVIRLAGLAKDSGLAGVVASANEVAAIKAACGAGFITVTPGIRPGWAAADDQKRVATPAEALHGGADYLVVGRPIIAAADPEAAAERTLEEMARA